MRRLIIFIILSSLPFISFATHQRAAEITVKHIGGLTYEATIITYVYTPSPADRPELTIYWGDGTSSILTRTLKQNLPDNISLNEYRYVPELGAITNRHTYSSQGTYTISMEDPNRNFGVINIPNSVNVPMYVQTELVINPFLGYNNSPTLLNPPVDLGCVNKPYFHNPGAFDTDGDSLSYKLVICKTAGGIDIPGYTFPEASNIIQINPTTGDITWDSPILQGEYNIAILITEWRNGVKIGSLTRDMQIEIIACSNNPPMIETINDTCVEAGDLLEFSITAYDPDGSTVVLTATGGPFEVPDSPAFMDPNPAGGNDTVSAVFSWLTECVHVRQQPYQVFFKVEDNGFPISLVNFKTVLIQVISPPPRNIIADPIGSSIHVSWDQVECDQALGYYIYRRIGPSGFIPEFCQVGVPASTGYVKIGETQGIASTSFVDDNDGNGLIQGPQYCYLITAYFQDGAESYASLETCAALKRDVPVITNVSNDSIDLDVGKIYLAWSKPVELDTIEIPGPYFYKVYRSPGLSLSSPELITTKEGLNDTIFFDESVNVNTSGSAYSYRIGLESESFGFIGNSQVASSIILSISPTDEELQLTWQLNVTWNNEYYAIYRKLPGTSTYDSIGFTNTKNFNDTLLVNGDEYCYYIKSTGSYGSSGFVEPIINFSQIACGIPYDNKPPCPPVLSVVTDCDNAENNLSWTNPNLTCADDVIKYYIFFSPLEGTDFTLLDSITGAENTSYTHVNAGNIVGCYVVTAIDSIGNQSEYSNVVCVPDTACTLYSLPNIFTPNDDGYNDTFIPFPYTSIEKINIKIFNRWGNLIYQTEDPDINWDGRNQSNNTLCEDGTYFYVCEVYEITLYGIRQRTLQGVITLLR